MTKSDVDERYRAPALDKGLDILELLAEQPSGMTRAEIVKAMGRGPSEVYRMVERLVARQYVSRSAEGDRYALSMKLFLLGSTHPPLRRLISKAQPLMDKFARQSLQSIHLAAPETGRAVVIAQASGPADWEFRLRVGAQLDLKTTGSGKTLLAFQGDERREELLAASNSNFFGMSASELKDIYRELDEIKQTGHRVSVSGQLVGVTDISAATLGKDGNAFGVLTCPYIQRVSNGSGQDVMLSIDETKALLFELASAISIL